MNPSSTNEVFRRFIGDRVVNISVYFGPHHVVDGCHIHPSIAMSPPTVTNAGFPHRLYSLMMIDIDARSPTDLSMDELIYWWVVDIPGGSTANSGREIVENRRPGNHRTTHSYIVDLFEQRGPLGVARLAMEGNADRERWRGYLVSHMLRLLFNMTPVSLVFFYIGRSATYPPSPIPVPGVQARVAEVDHSNRYQNTTPNHVFFFGFNRRNRLIRIVYQPPHSHNTMPMLIRFRRPNSNSNTAQQDQHNPPHQQ